MISAQKHKPSATLKYMHSSWQKQPPKISNGGTRAWCASPALAFEECGQISALFLLKYSLFLKIY